ncbi:MAG TPA: acyl-CoA-binding protein [Ornithinibacter sp.]|nr:acyl-CoA-binding protein [Ornithinibacter sp.]
MASEDEFHAAVERVNTLMVDPGNSVKLQLYALYKQATEGDVTGKRPGFTNPVGRAKYDAWAEREGLSAEDARDEYVAIASSLGG